MEHDHSSHTDTMTNMTSDHLMMSPYLITRTTGYFVLFREANIGSTGGFLAALVLVFLFSTLVTLYSLMSKKWENRAVFAKKGSKLFWLGALAYAARLGLHWVLMLIVMTMEVWLILAIVVGSFVGWVVHFAFFRDATPVAEVVKSSDREAVDDVYKGSCQCASEKKCDPKACVSGNTGGCDCC